ncbi:hypothetical protein Vadar_002053 [Vaccinium darrowii]|uniref:Uncharacterized protein n=1 Tax=Vaccinium darrowii TaxID=229202 RepID=A0ACB7Z9V6_9ERIC|nr:hypothetical protein Vadar_002053 [Vaccinium darrowii]
MITQPLATTSLPIRSSSENITAEEEDHLVRSTKKVKNDHDYSVDMAEDAHGVESPQIQDAEMSNNEENMKTQSLEVPGNAAVTNTPEVLSFKQVLIANRGKEIPFSEDVEAIRLDEDDPDEEDDADDEEEIDGIPVVKLPKSLLKYSRQPWKNAVIVKPIGYPIGYKALCTKVRSIWDIQGDFSALEIGMGFVVFKFDMASDRAHVLTAGPWIINDQYITVREWEPRFKPDEAEEIKTAVWVRFPNFPLEYYYEKNMFRIARRIGRPIRADSTTVETDRGRYARVCVEIDLSKPVKSKIIIEGKVYCVEYEHIPLMCFGCGRIGHRRDQCTWGSKTTPPAGESAQKQPVTASVLTLEETNANVNRAQATSIGHNIGKAAQTPAYGHWTLVQRKPRRPNTGRRYTDRSYMVQNSKFSGPNSQKMENRENRFSILNGLDGNPSSSKRPNPSNRVPAETNTSQPTRAKPKSGIGSKEPILENPNPSSAFSPVGSSTTANPQSQSSGNQKLSPLPIAITTSKPHSPQPPHPPTRHPAPDGNRDIPPPPSSDLHPDQTRGRRRSTGQGGLVDSESEIRSDSTRLQHSTNPVLRSGSGESQGHGERPDGGHENDWKPKKQQGKTAFGRGKILEQNDFVTQANL